MNSRILFLLTVSGSLTAQIITGPDAPGLAGLDKVMTDLMTKYQVPGASLAVTYQGRLVLAHGYGTMDAAGSKPTQPNSLFRIASLSKQITAVTILRLAQDGKLNLDTPALDIVNDIQPPPGATVDPRIKTITIRQLLEHTGGFDSDISVDPMFNDIQISRDLNIPEPPGSDSVIRWMLGRPLDFDPGSRFAYSNFGYCILGRVVEHVTGMNYEIYVRNHVLAPMGIEAMRIGNTMQVGQLPGEVSYLHSGNGPNVFSFGPRMVPWSYGGWYLESMDSHGGWVASTIDLMKFWNSIEGRRGTAFLNPASIVTMTAKPNVPAYANSNSWYALGFQIDPDVNKGVFWSHSGFLDGQSSYAVRSAAGWDYAAFFNATPNTQAASAASGNKPVDFYSEMDTKVYKALTAVTWPTSIDHFPDYAPSAGAASAPQVQAQDGVVDGASFHRGIVSGSWVTITGANLSATTRIWKSSDFSGNNLPASLDGVSVNINGKPAAVYFISPSQVNVQAPTDTTIGMVTLEVIYNGQSSGVVEAEMRAISPGLFTYAAGNQSAAAAVLPSGIVIGNPAVTPGTMQAHPGDQISLYATGLAVSPAGRIIAAPVPLTPLPVVTVGGVDAKVTYAGLAGVGLYQVNIVVPQLADGDQPIIVQSGGVASQTAVSLSVHH